MRGRGAGGAGISFDVPLVGIRQQGPAVMVPYVPVNINPPVQGAVPPQVPRVIATVEVHTVQDNVAKIMSTKPLASLPASTLCFFFPLFFLFGFVFPHVLHILLTLFHVRCGIVCRFTRLFTSLFA
jgi:hypothetical protein